ncbi:TATA element modulatory factor-like isoform X1 [Biomphalaria glabrata]|nr:TATA element modulatory factor-like isoform X1 [Biomphalaria glabrata]
MSWWDPSGITNLASQALKNAQKKIDKVLDIDAEGGTDKSHKKKNKEVKVQVNEEENSATKAQEGDFWSTWMSSGDAKDEKENPDHHSSWSLPWSIASKSSESLSSSQAIDEPLTKSNNTIDISQQSDISKDYVHSHKDNETVPEAINHSETAFNVQESSSVVSDWQDFSIDDSFSETNVLESAQSFHLIQDQHSDIDDKQSVPYNTMDLMSPRNEEVVKNSMLDIETDQIQCITVSLSADNNLDLKTKEIANESEEYVEASHDFIDQHLLSGESLNETSPQQEELELPALASSAEPAYLSSTNVTCESQEVTLPTYPLTVGDKPKTLQNILPSPDIETTEQHVADDQRLLRDLVQDYVNVISIRDVAQTASYDGSTVSSEDLLNTNTELEMGYSRTSSDLDLMGGHASSTGSSDTSKLDSSIDTVVDQTIVDSHSDNELTENDPTFSILSERTKEDCLDSSKTLEESAQSLSSSYVKCMIEEAMEDFSKTEDSGSDNHSNGEKSESSKQDSELEKSIYSGHESSDEIETTTSSDIEIITAPSSNGESKYGNSFEISPMKIVLQRSVRQHGHSQSDIQSSSSANSKGDLDRLSPEREVLPWKEDDFQHHELHRVSDDNVNNPYHPEQLLKLCHLVLQHKVLGGQKLAEMAEVLQARENKLVQLSKDNHQLMEDNNILRCQLQQSEEAREAETADLNALTNEFTARLSEAEKKLQAVIKEKENLKQKLNLTEKELEKRSGSSSLQALLDEKQEQVVQLLAEGEKLSKQQLQSSTIIKKLRAKEKENDATITSQKKKIDELTKEVEKLTSVLDSREDLEKKQSDAITQLNAAVQRQEKELVKLKSDLEDSQEKNRGLLAALDNSYKEIAELHKSNASQDSKAQEAALSAETHVREELKAAMEREQQKFRQDREAFIMQIDDLRLEMARLEKEHSRREDLLRQEITHLQEGLQQNEARNQDLTQCVTSATRPLLRQIENLQATYGAQSAAWEKVEKTLTDRLAESQTALAIAQEKERTATEQLMELSARSTSLEASNSRLKQEKLQLVAQIENDKSQLEELRDARNSHTIQLEANKQKLSQEVNQLKMDKIQLESQLTVEQAKLETERKKNIALEEQLRLAQERPRSRGTPSPSSTLSLSRNNSMIGSISEGQSNNIMHWSFHDDSDSGSMLGGPRVSVYDSMRQSGAAAVVENLSSQLKLREGEIIQLQSEIGQLERTRESMARELVNLSNQIDELSEVKETNTKLQENFNELNGRYSAILQMYGEKEEQVQELKLDLQDVKEMYKSQIDALLAK